MRRSLPVAAAAVAALSLLAAACSARRPQVAGESVVGSDRAASAGRAGALSGAPLREAVGAQPAGAQLIRRGRIGVEVARVDESRRRLERAAASLGADVASSEVSEDRHADYLFRVPPERLDALMDSAATLGTVGERVTSSEDVTAQVVDVEGRLAALRLSRDRLRQLMDRASTVPDVITVERELARVQGELESMERLLESLRGQVARSELAVHLERPPVLGPLGALFVGIGRAIRKLFVR